MSWFKIKFLLLNCKKTYLELGSKTCINSTLGINYFIKNIANVQ